MDRDYLLEVGEMYHRALREKEIEVDRLTHELVSTRGFLEGAQTTLQESGSRLEELLEETSQGSTTSISTESQMFTSATSPEDVGGLVEERQMMEVHEGYPGSLMVMERYDQETLEDVQVSQGPPFMGVLRQLVIHIHMGIPEPGVVMRTHPFGFQDWMTSM
jgi:hypothetical protein